MAIRLEVPAFAYDYINGTSGTYSNTPYASKYYYQRSHLLCGDAESRPFQLS